jgi:23S rRNA pseudouridine1911/1915/1917 synthase
VVHVLYEDNHLLVLNKPAGLATMGVEQGTSSLVFQAKAYLKRKYDKPGNVYLGVVSRLDAAVSGVIVLARTSKAADRLSRQFREGTVDKTYWALVSPTLRATAGEWTDFLRKDEAVRRMAVCRQQDEGAQQARLVCRRLARNQRYAWLEIDLLTGRKHQIRLQCATRGSPVAGDRKYGSTVRFGHGIALHSLRLQLEHPTRREMLEFTAPPPPAWQTALARFGWSNESP